MAQGCHTELLQTRHNYEISYPFEWGACLEKSSTGTANPICLFLRMRELRQNVEFLLNLPRSRFLISPSADMVASANPFARMKLVRVTSAVTRVVAKKSYL